MPRFQAVLVIPEGLHVEHDGHTVTITGTRPEGSPASLAAAEDLMRVGAALLPGLLQPKTEAN